jgi:hypothetical protein
LQDNDGSAVGEEPAVQYAAAAGQKDVKPHESDLSMPKMCEEAVILPCACFLLPWYRYTQ